jgi:hypothetical protein
MSNKERNNPRDPPIDWFISMGGDVHIASQRSEASVRRG